MKIICLDSKGMSLIEVLIVAGIMAVMALAMLTMQDNQRKSNNFLEFQLKRTQLQNTLINQVLNDPNNCACFFAGSADFPATPVAPGATLTGAAPTQLGRLDFVTPGVCGTATMPQVLVDAAGVDGLKLVSAQLKNIMSISGSYAGVFVANLQATKAVLGTTDLQLKIPVNVAVTPSGANVAFASCTTQASTTVVPTIYDKRCGIHMNGSPSLPPGYGYCAPPACATGDADLGADSCQLHQIGAPWMSAECNRVCVHGTPSSGMSYSKRCAWLRPSPPNLASDNECNPQPCAPGHVDLGTSCADTGVPNFWIGGYCERICTYP